MPLICSAPVPAGERHEIPDGARYVAVHLDLDWGSEDLRESHQGDYVFCSFACLVAWATEMAERHDAHVLVEGEPPKEA